MTAFTSVPPGERTTPGARPGAPAPVRAAEYLAVSFGEAGTDVAAQWLAASSASAARRRHIAAQAADGVALRALTAHVGGAAVGLRVLLAGPEADVYAAAAAAKAAGLIEEELSLAVAGTGAKRVFCPHCGATTPALVPVGGTVPCAGCDRGLEVYHHFSRRSASYLGFMADAVEAPPMSVLAEGTMLPELEAAR